VHARADTLLDQDLDRIARGEAPLLPELERVEAALADRANALERAGYGLKSESGKFYFREGAREELRANELDRAGLEHAKAHGRAYRDLASDPGLAPDHVWDVREVKELFAGRAAIIGRGSDIAVVPMKAGQSVEIGDQIGIKMRDGPGAQKAIELIQPQDLAKTLGRGLDLSR
jgi:hypothetical protein